MIKNKMINILLVEDDEVGVMNVKGVINKKQHQKSTLSGC